MSSVRTASGKLFDVLNPRNEDVNMHDIALGLSREGRYANQTIFPYYVTQHCVLLSYLCPPKMAMQAMTHECGEVFLRDLPSPIKKLLPDYSNLDHNLTEFFYKKYEVETFDDFHYYDQHIRNIEKDNLFKNNTSTGNFKIQRLTPEKSYDLFARRYFNILGVSDCIFHKMFEKIIIKDDRSFWLFGSKKIFKQKYNGYYRVDTEPQINAVSKVLENCVRDYNALSS